MKELVINKKRYLEGVDFKIKLRKLSRKSDPMEGKERELVSMETKNGSLDMKFGSIKTEERQMTDNLDETADQRRMEAEGEERDYKNGII